MPALNFKDRFAEDVRLRRKRQTIRRQRKNPIKAGDTLYLNTGMRTKHDFMRLGIEPCVSVDPIEIMETGTTVKGQWLNQKEELALAQADGFETVSEFRDFFRQQYGLPFCDGVLIKW